MPDFRRRKTRYLELLNEKAVSAGRAGQLPCGGHCKPSTMWHSADYIDIIDGHRAAEIGLRFSNLHADTYCISLCRDCSRDAHTVAMMRHDHYGGWTNRGVQ